MLVNSPHVYGVVHTSYLLCSWQIDNVGKVITNKKKKERVNIGVRNEEIM